MIDGTQPGTVEPSILLVSKAWRSDTKLLFWQTATLNASFMWRFRVTPNIRKYIRIVHLSYDWPIHTSGDFRSFSTIYVTDICGVLNMWEEDHENPGVMMMEMIKENLKLHHPRNEPGYKRSAPEAEIVYVQQLHLRTVDRQYIVST